MDGTESVPLIRRKCEKFFLFLLKHVAISGAFVLVFPGLEELFLL